MPMERISCIIPAYNEERGIRNVLSAVSGHPSIAEVIVIDDGSTDRTKDIVLEFAHARLLVNEKNIGKTASICRGICESSGTHIFFLDADLTGLTRENITSLIQPIIGNGSSGMSMSLRNYYAWRVFGVDPLSGERILPRAFLLDHLQQLSSLPAFALEVFLNTLHIENDHRITVVPWMNVHAPLKLSKYGVRVGVHREIRMWQDILEYISFPEVVRQFWRMRSLTRRGAD